MKRAIKKIVLCEDEISCHFCKENSNCYEYHFDENANTKLNNEIINLMKHYCVRQVELKDRKKAAKPVEYEKVEVGEKCGSCGAVMIGEPCFCPFCGTEVDRCGD